MQNKITLRNYIRTKFAFLPEEHQNLLNGFCLMLRGTLKDIENAKCGRRNDLFKHMLSMARFPVQKIFPSRYRMDSKWKFISLP